MKQKICYFILMIFVAGILYGEDMTLEQELKEINLKITYHELFGPRDISVGNQLINFEKKVKKLLPYTDFEIHTNPDVARLLGPVVYRNSDKELSLYEYLENYCRNAGLSMKVSENILISREECGVMEISEEARKILKLNQSKIEYSCIGLNKIPKGVVYVHKADEDDFRAECNNRTFTDIPAFVNYLNTIKHNIHAGIIFCLNKNRSSSDKIFTEIIIGYAFMNNLVLYKHTTSSSSLGSLCTKYIFYKELQILLPMNKTERH